MEMLPTAVAKSSSANAATTEMLELSRDFSDYSSFNSDISRELERLAAAAATPGSDAPDLAAVDLNNLGPMDWIRLLAKHRSDICKLVSVPGEIPALVPLLRSTDPMAQENTVKVLLNLSLEERNRSAITAAGAIKSLVYTLWTGTASAKQNASCALLSLSGIEDNRATIGVCGAIAPLVPMLSAGSTRGNKDAIFWSDRNGPYCCITSVPL
ncbi:hypothetical protein ZWY2020_057162 [Hordeum vulgare]|nr:hypothetical protein ZWY2020_057162 [Hordeum vulgare]